MGLDHMMDDPRYAKNPARVANRESLIAELQKTFSTRTYEEWEAILIPAGIPLGAINGIDAVVTHPQVMARNALPAVDHPIAGTVRVAGPPVRMSETPGSVRTPAPLLGQHTDEVLRDRLGLSAAELDALRRAGTIA
jgi:CoA:oxalate CoA-transferase